jgi:hypothetical protein
LGPAGTRCETRIAANVSRESVVSEEKPRNRRAAILRQIGQWQKQCNEGSAEETGGTQMESEGWRWKLEQIPKQLKQLRRSGLKKMSVTDPDSRFLRTREGFERGNTGDIAVSEDHLIVAQRVTQNPTDTESLNEMAGRVEQRCGATPRQVSADSDFYRNEEIQALMDRGADAYVGDSNTAQELNGGSSADQTAECIANYGTVVSRMREKLRSPQGTAAGAKVSTSRTEECSDRILFYDSGLQSDAPAPDQSPDSRLSERTQARQRPFRVC